MEKKGVNTMDKKEALLVWQHEYGDQEYAYDIVGRKIKRDDYMVLNQVGWVVTYMCPIEFGGGTDEGNTIILHHHTASEKGIDYPDFCVDEKHYTVKHDLDGDFYYIESLEEEE